jgi:YidC/Oxa1 family membrane protein insertase
MVIAFLPTIFLKKPAPPVAADSAVAGVDASTVAPGAASLGAPAPVLTAGDTIAAAPTAPMLVEDTIVVRSPIYAYGISTRGGRIISARFLEYRTLAEGEGRDTLELVPGAAPLLDNRLIIAGDTVDFEATGFTADADELVVGAGETKTLTLTGTVRGLPATLRYTFQHHDYRIEVAGTVGGLPVTGATLLLGMGEGFRQTEAVAAENLRESGVVVKRDKTELTRYSALEPDSTQVFGGPFEWAAVKNKYFVLGVFAYDSLRTDGPKGQIGSVIATVRDTAETVTRAEVVASLTVPTAGGFAATVYLGPMEYDHLTGMGRDFDDVNPYGWPGFRTIIRPFAVGIRTVFVWMHESLGLAYGWVVVAFGVLIRLLLWPLNQKAMRSMTAMQAIQPELQRLQERYKQDPQKLQTEMFKLYKEHNVNPLGGCWPMLLPYPFLIAVFFVLANTIELRGVGFLWMPDLARFDPLYIIPVVMAGSMYLMTKIGQMGMPPNPQAKMMMYVMPVLFLVMFSKFASGLNLYYAVQNLAALPQQWLIMQERKKLAGSRKS